MIAQRDLEKAVTQPWSVYDEPEDVLTDDRLSSEQKRRILESWERDARELAVAEEENMAGGEPNRLGRVLEALAELPANDARPSGAATKHGSQAAPSAAGPPRGGQRLTGQEARQGETILRSPARKAIFIGVIVLAAVICVLLFYEATV